MAFRGLNLTDAQKTQIKQIMQQSFASLKSQAQAVHQQREAFEALSPSASNYQSAAASLAQAEANFTSARITARAAVTAQIYNSVLTSAQQSQYISQKAAVEARKAQWQQFKAEPPRESLTQPPAGYQTPSSGFAYGTGPKESMNKEYNPAAGKYGE